MKMGQVQFLFGSIWGEKGQDHLVSGSICALIEPRPFSPSDKRAKGQKK
ncbi:MAG: hypothetical protein ACI8UP_002955 [Porticoccaceae bacterium]|jgi:hypothetical protein